MDAVTYRVQAMDLSGKWETTDETNKTKLPYLFAKHQSVKRTTGQGFPGHARIYRNDKLLAYYMNGEMTFIDLNAID